MAGTTPSWCRAFPAGDTVDHTRPIDPRGSRAEEVFGLVFFAFLAGGALLALINIRAGRWDRRGALRLALAAFVLCFASETLGAHHTWNAVAEARGVFSAVAYAATRALMTWLLFVAMEPFIRRLRPTSLVSWSRLLSGRVRDPAIGRDVLIGLAALTLQGAALSAWFGARGWTGSFLPIYALSSGESVLTAASALALYLRLPVVALGNCLGFLLLYAGLRSLLARARWAASVILWLAIAFVSAGGSPAEAIATGVILGSTFTFLAVRGGLLAMTVGWAFFLMFSFAPVTLDPADWYSAPTVILLLLVLGLIVFAVRIATAGRRSASISAHGDA